MSARTIPSPRIPTQPHQRFLRHLYVKALCWISAKTLFALGFATNKNPRYEHLNKHAWEAVKGASELECQAGSCRIDGEAVE